MGQLHPLLRPDTAEEAPIQSPAPVHAADVKVSTLDVRCALCGSKLGTRALRHQLVPPQSARQSITVCHTCNKAALGEGYRPVA